MMKKTFGTIVIGVAALSSISAYAEAIPGAYATIRAGYKTMGFSHESDYFTDKFGIKKDAAISLKGRGGLDLSVGWLIDPMFGVEIAGYTDLLGADSGTKDIPGEVQKAKDAGVADVVKGVFNKFNVQQRAVAVLGKAVVPVAEDVNVTFKAGVSYLFSQESAFFNATQSDPTKEEKTARTDVQTRFAPIVSAGVNYTLSPDVLTVPASVGISATGIIPINGKDAPQLKPILFASVELTTYFG